MKFRVSLISLLLIFTAAASANPSEADRNSCFTVTGGSIGAETPTDNTDYIVAQGYKSFYLFTGTTRLVCNKSLPVGSRGAEPFYIFVNGKSLIVKQTDDGSGRLSIQPAPSGLPPGNTYAECVTMPSSTMDNLIMNRLKANPELPYLCEGYRELHTEARWVNECRRQNGGLSVSRTRCDYDLNRDSIEYPK